MTPLAAICSLIREFNWSIEDVINLNWSQIEALNLGLGELHTYMEKNKPIEEQTPEELVNNEDYQEQMKIQLDNSKKNNNGKLTNEALFKMFDRRKK